MTKKGGRGGARAISKKTKNSLGRYGNLSDEQVWPVIFFRDLRERHMIGLVNINPSNRPTTENCAYLQ